MKTSHEKPGVVRFRSDGRRGFVWRSFTREEIGAAFANKSSKPDTRGCINWIGASKKNGYGSFSVNCVVVYAHRFAWSQVNGKIPEGLDVLHKCDNRKCVNVDHLFLGTAKDNLNDARIKGRLLTGEDSPQARLTLDQVVKIHALKGKVLQRRLATRFGVSRQTVSDIQRGKRWHYELNRLLEKEKVYA